MTFIIQNFGPNLARLRIEKGVSQTQLFGTSKEIELEKSVLESNEYSDKVSEILKAVKYIEHFQLSYLFSYLT